MERIEILLATMHQKDFSFIEKMNIKSDIIAANQTDSNSFRQISFQDNIAKLISSSDRGVGKNRNVALAYSSGDILIFSDDDIVYSDDYNENVIKAFADTPKADIIIFDVDFKNVPEREKEANTKNNRVKRVSFFNFTRHGTYKIAIRRSSWQRANIWFSELFGGGAIYGSGEDTLFLRHALKNKLKIYTHPYKLAVVDQTNSTWFEGFNEKYFFDKGVLIGAVFPRLKYIIWLYFWYAFIKKSEIKKVKAARLMLKGIKAQKKSIAYKSDN